MTSVSHPAQICASPFPRAAAQLADRVAGCLLGGAAGDALGAPLEFMSRAAIVRRFGAQGIRDHAHAYGRLGAITDDTQMTLFTAEGLLRAASRERPPAHASCVAEVALAYQRWLLTQEGNPRAHRGASGLLGVPELHSRRAPGTTCLSALAAARGDRLRDTVGKAPPVQQRASNDSKGCGGVMRVAPAGLLLARTLDDAEALPREAFALGADLAALTHGHPSGYLTGGVLAALVALLVRGVSLGNALDRAMAALAEHRGHEETLSALESARTLAAAGPANHAVLARLGEGWVAEEALAISVYCALCAPDFEQALVVAVNHSGDSDSTGAITGNLLGAAAGTAQIPERWLEPLELAALTREIAAQIARA